MPSEKHIDKEISAPLKNFKKKKDSTLRLKSEFDFVKNNGLKFVSRSFIILYSVSSDFTFLRIGVICGRKFSRKAVVRNRVRRVVKEAFRLIWDNVKPMHILIIPRRFSENLKTQEAQTEIIKALKKLNQWKEELT